MGGSEEDLKAQRTAAKEQGINATTISKGFSRYPQLMGTEQVPGVSIMTDVGTRVPLGTKPSEEVRRQATQTVRNPQVVLTTSQTLGQKAAAIANREPVATPKPTVVVPVKPTVKPAVKPTAKPTVKPKPKPKVTTKSKMPKGTSTVRVVDVVAPSQERFGPGGMMSTIDQPHERQFMWNR
jgi:hypothetical protein